MVWAVAGLGLVFYLSPALFAWEWLELPSLVGELVFWEWRPLSVFRVLVSLAAIPFLMVGVGDSIRILIRPREPEVTASFVVAAALGIGGLGVLILGVGLVGLLHHRVLAVVFTCLLIRAMFVVPGWLEHHQIPLKRLGFSPVAWGVVLALCCWYGFFMLADLLAPEGFWDAIVYHLGVPRRYLEMHKIVLMPPFFSNYPLLMSMNYLPALWAGAEEAARALNLALGSALVWTVFRIGRLWLTPSQAFLAAGLAGGTPLLVLLMLHAGSDMGMAVFALLSLYAFMRAFPSWPRPACHRSWLAMAGCFAGLAGSAKLPGLVVPAVLLLLLAPAWRFAPWFLVPAGIVFAPWLVKSWLMTGDPVYPWLAALGGRPAWPPFSSDAYAGELLRVWNQLSLGDFTPWRSGEFPVSRFKLGLLGPVAFLGAVSTLTFRAPGRKPLVPLLFIAALAVLWAVSVPAYRFFVAGFALLPLFLPWGSLSRWRYPVVGAVLILHAVWLPHVLDEVDRPWLAARGRISPGQYYRGLHANSSLDATTFLEKVERPGTGRRVLAVGEVRNYLTPTWSVVSSYFEPTPFVEWARECASADRLLIRLKQRGIGYLLVNAPEMMRLWLWERLCWDREFPEETLYSFFRAHTRLIYSRSAGWVYRISKNDDQGAALPECFTLDRGQDSLNAFTCVTLIEGVRSAQEPGSVLRYGWAAVAARPHSSLAWAALGDCLFTSEDYEQAVGAYAKALGMGWRTSAVYRNQAVAFAKMEQFASAQQALLFARRIDPLSARIREDLAAVMAELSRRHAKKRNGS